MTYSVHIAEGLSTHSCSHESDAYDSVSFVYDRLGRRKYLTPVERQAFLRAAKVQSSAAVATFCSLLAHTGARLSEACALTPQRIDFDMQVIVVRSLKKRSRTLYRAVPVPTPLLAELDAVHEIRGAQIDPVLAAARIWTWCRTTAWHHVKQTMEFAGIEGPQAMPKGLRHGFAVAALQTGVPINMVQRWLGHARLTTTAIYADAVGEEERRFAEMLWNAGA